MKLPDALSFPNHWVQSIKDTDAHQRIDAEHFQPFFTAIEEAIKATTQSQALGGLISYCKRGQQPEYVAGGEVLVLNSQHIGAHFANIDAAERTSLDFWERKAQARVKVHDVLVNSTGLGSIGRVNCVMHDQKTVVDNHVTVVRVIPGKIDPLYLAVFLNSSLGREQTYKWQSGSSGQLELYPDDIRRFVVTVPDAPVQSAIAAGYDQAYKAYRLASESAGKAEKAALEVTLGA